MKTPELLPPPETMYRALRKRDASFEGIFLVGVRTTGIFCRPTCTAKKPARENVDFFATAGEALHEGYRPCLRCHPMDPDKRPPKLIERLRTEVERAPDGRVTDKELTAMAIDPSTARRHQTALWNDISGLSSRAPDGSCFERTSPGRSRDRARNGSGFESESGFREAFTKIFANHPLPERVPMFAERIDTPLGAMTPSRTMKDCVCLSLSTDARPNVNCRSCASDCEPMSCRASIRISQRRASSSVIIFPAKIWSLMFRWRRSDRTFNCVPGKSFGPSR